MTVMLRLAAFFSGIGVILFAGLVVGTLMAWFDGSYSGGLGQLLLHQLVQVAFLGMSTWGAIRSWRRRQALPPAERSRLGMGCLVVICLGIAVVMGFAFASRWTNRKVAEDTKALAPPVIAALDRFRAANKEFPRTLDQLVPEYLPAVPLCRLGDDRPRMAYRLEESGYELACPTSALMRWRYRYRSGSGEWDLTD